MSIIKEHYGLPEEGKQEDCQEPFYTESEREFVKNCQQATFVLCDQTKYQGKPNIFKRSPSTIFERFTPREDAMVDYIIKLSR